MPLAITADGVHSAHSLGLHAGLQPHPATGWYSKRRPPKPRRDTGLLAIRSCVSRVSSQLLPSRSARVSPVHEVNPTVPCRRLPTASIPPSVTASPWASDRIRLPACTSSGLRLCSAAIRICWSSELAASGRAGSFSESPGPRSCFRPGSGPRSFAFHCRLRPFNPQWRHIVGIPADPAYRLALLAATARAPSRYESFGPRIIWTATDPSPSLSRSGPRPGSCFASPARHCLCSFQVCLYLPAALDVTDFKFAIPPRTPLHSTSKSRALCPLPLLSCSHCGTFLAAPPQHSRFKSHVLYAAGHSDQCRRCACPLPSALGSVSCVAAAHPPARPEPSTCRDKLCQVPLFWSTRRMCSLALPGVLEISSIHVFLAAGPRRHS